MSEHSDMGAVNQAADDSEILLILANDHRASLERDLYGLKAAPTPSQATRIAADKLIVYDALLDAAEKLPRNVQVGILVDEQYGAGVAELAAATSGVVNLSMPIEASGQDWFEFAYGDDWQEHAEFFSTSHAKVLVRDNPGLDPARRAQQAELVAKVSTWAIAAERPLILELLIPPSQADLQAVQGNQASYDVDIRPHLTVESITYLQDHGVEPAIWKVEGLDRHDDAEALVEVAQRGGRTARSIVLGRHAEHDRLDHWLQVAAPIPSYIGFAIGRSIWWDALHAHLRHRATDVETQRRITYAYLDFANYYLDAREGNLAAADPDFW